MDLSESEDYNLLHKYLMDKYTGADVQFLFYLSVPAESAIEICDNLGAAGLNLSNIKIMIEKPFGSDLKSASAFLKKISKYFREEQVYKIDHYLMKKNLYRVISDRIHNKDLNDK
jgi:glucose-6-phosphate 1-dehydrogenase